MVFKKKSKKTVKKVVKAEAVKEEPKVVVKKAPKVETITCACGIERVSKTFCTNCGATN